MIKTVIFSIMSFVLIASSALAQMTSIQLNDGSVIKGKVVSMSNGQYTIDTAAMGTITLNEAEVAGIGAGAAAPMAAGNDGMQQQVMAMQQQIFSDPAMMAEIQAMAQDPEIMQLLSDPALMQAATQMDVNGVQSNPNTQKLMQNPKMQELIEKMGGQMGAGGSY